MKILKKFAWKLTQDAFKLLWNSRNWWLKTSELFKISKHIRNRSAFGFERNFNPNLILKSSYEKKEEEEEEEGKKKQFLFT